MTIVEIRGGPLTHKKLMRRNKHSLAALIMDVKRSLETMSDAGRDPSKREVEAIIQRIYFS